MFDINPFAARHRQLEHQESVEMTNAALPDDFLPEDEDTKASEDLDHSLDFGAAHHDDFDDDIEYE